MIYFGIDNLLQQSPDWKTARIGLVTNHAATTRSLVPSRQALLEAGFKIVKLFSPEHGLDVKGADGQPMRDGVDPLTGLGVTSLYSGKLSPDEADHAELDVILFDIPDIGCRFYTYLWTMTHVMESCARYGTRLIVLDRPNPVSGLMDLAEGPVLDESQSSFIGRWSLPVRHSCTLGELALYFNETKKLGCKLEVIKCSGWRREMFQPDWGTTFVATSPAICRFEAMQLYPGLCLLEATNVSEGRGTDWSFQSVGAPWLQAKKMAQILAQMGMDELRFTAGSFIPAHSKFAGQRCEALHFEVVDALAFKPVFFGMLLMKMIRDIHGALFRWDVYPTLVNPAGTHHLDKLLGVGGSEQLFELPLQSFLAKAQQLTAVREWETAVSGYLLY